MHTSSTKPFRIIVTGSIWASTLLALWCAASLFFGANPFDLNPFDDRPFDSKIWAEDAASMDGGNRRGRMCDDLLKHHLHFGESRGEVIDLLGSTPVITDRSATLRDFMARSKKYLVVAQPSWDDQVVTILKYQLGEEFNLLIGVDLAAAYLAFDSNDRYIAGRCRLALVSRQRFTFCLLDTTDSSCYTCLSPYVRNRFRAECGPRPTRMFIDLRLTTDALSAPALLVSELDVLLSVANGGSLWNNERPPETCSTQFTAFGRF